MFIVSNICNITKTVIMDACRKLSLVAPPPSATGLSTARLSDGLPPSPSTSSPAYRRPDWLLFNDFCITPCAPAEVLTLFGNQKVPCLLYYSRVTLLPSVLSAKPPLQCACGHHRQHGEQSSNNQYVVHQCSKSNNLSGQMHCDGHCTAAWSLLANFGSYALAGLKSL